MEKMVTPSFWQGRHVFVTGHTGFKGAWLSLWLQRLRARLTGYALAPPTQPCLFDLAQVGNAMRSIIGDVRDGQTLASEMRAAEPEVVFHLAAQPLVRASYLDPVETFSTNIMGTVHLLEAVRQCPSVRAVVVVTSDKCYDNQEWPWAYRENEALGGRDPYSASKAGAEIVTAAYRDSYFPSLEPSAHHCAIATARAGNVIGGGDWARDRLFPELAEAFAKQHPVVLRNPLATRPWQHVLEPLSGYLALAERLAEKGASFAEAWNFGPDENDTRNVASIAEIAANYWRQTPAWRQGDASHPHEAQSLRLDSQKARQRLGWHPKWSLDQAIAATCEWYLAYQAGEDVASLTRRQIDEWQGQQ